MKPSLVKFAMPEPPHKRPAQYDYRRFISPQIPTLDATAFDRPEPEEGAVQITSRGTFDFIGGEWIKRGPRA